MIRLIDAESTKEIIVGALTTLKNILGKPSEQIIDSVIRTVCSAFDDAETVDPVKHGRWFWCGDNTFSFKYECSGCGAKMDGE